MKILQIPEFRQTYGYDCGAKAAQSIHAYYGIDIREDKIIKLAGTNKNGTSIEGIVKVLKMNKLKCDVSEMNIDDIKKYLDKKIPVIILLQAWTLKKKVDWKENWDDGHYVVAIGYDSKKIYFDDPSSVLRTYLTYKELLNRWHDVIKGKKYFNCGIAVYGKRPMYSYIKVKHMG